MAREDVPVEELEMVEAEVERRSREVVVEDELVLVRLLVVAFDDGVAEDPVVIYKLFTSSPSLPRRAQPIRTHPLPRSVA